MSCATGGAGSSFCTVVGLYGWFVLGTGSSAGGMNTGLPSSPKYMRSRSNAPWFFRPKLTQFSSNGARASS